MNIDRNLLEDRLEDNGEPIFQCDCEEERVGLFTALDELGYRWNSGHALFEWGDPMEKDDEANYFQTHGDRRVIYASMDVRKNHPENVVPVSELAANPVDPADVLALLGG